MALPTSQYGWRTIVGKRKSVESDSNLGQMLNLAGKDIKEAITNMLKELTENMLEKCKEILLAPIDRKRNFSKGYYRNEK